MCVVAIGSFATFTYLNKNRSGEQPDIRPGVFEGTGEKRFVSTSRKAGPSPSLLFDHEGPNFKRMKAKESLRKIARALQEYGRDHGSLPLEMDAKLTSLASYGDMQSILGAFEGGAITSYILETSSDARKQKASLQARIRGAKEWVKISVTFRR
jgi:hypothetical protein